MKLFESLFVLDVDTDFYPVDLSVVPAALDRTEATDKEPTIEGRLMRLEVGAGQAFSFVLFQLPNFLNYVGSWVRHDGKPEQTLVWDEDGVTCRSRIDWLRDDYSAIDDIKTTAHGADPDLFSRKTIYSYGYDVKAAFYLRGVKAVSGVDAEFRWLALETTPPYVLTVVSPGLDVIAHPFLAEREHFLRRVGDRKQRPRRLVDAGVGRLRR